jgi:LPXTG-motif cell wall-anchored protein
MKAPNLTPAALLCALALAVPATAAAQEPDPAAGPAPASAQPAEPAPAADEAPATQAPDTYDQAAEPQAAAAPTATPAQDDTSGLNEYSEGGVPTPTGDDTNPEPVDPGNAPAPTSSAPTTTTAPAATPAAETTTETTGLPRTGADSWAIALIGIALLAAGLVLRRRQIATLRS